MSGLPCRLSGLVQRRQLQRFEIARWDEGQALDKLDEPYPEKFNTRLRLTSEVMCAISNTPGIDMPVDAHLPSADSTLAPIGWWLLSPDNPGGAANRC